MAEEVKNTQDPFAQFFEKKAEEKAGEAKAEVQAAAGEAPALNIDVDDSMLTPAEKEAVSNFALSIDLKDTTSIMKYGAGVQEKMAGFSQKTLDQARTKDLGEVGELLADVVNEVKTIDTEEKKGLAGLFQKAKLDLSAMKSKYDKAETNIVKICDNLENHQITLMKDVEILDNMYQLNLDSYKELTMYILAGKEKLEDVRKNELAELQKTAAATGRAEDAQAVRDLSDQMNRFEKKLYDLDLSRTISMQTAPQIRLLQSTDTQMAEKIQSVIVNTIPLWKNQMVITLGIAHSQAAIEAESAVTNATNELLKKNSETLHTASVAAAKANERGIVDIETLKLTNQNLLTTLDEVMQIQQEGRAARANAELELRKMEGELKNKLLEMSKK